MIDITSQYTKERNKKCGRRGYGMWKREKVSNISPADFGSFLNEKKKRKKK